VTEDEAFVRAIIDSPGDDTPRLVYADWLDDRDDPRGPYLRAELEWARPWQTGTPPGWSQRVPGRSVPEWAEEHWRGLDEILAGGRGLDPVWVARVSRPPAGVCCDHLTFRDSGPRLTTEDLAAGERRLGGTFPTDLAAFLLNYNGGKPNRSQLVVRVGDEADGWSYDWVGLDWFAALPDSDGRPARNAGTLDSMRDELLYGEEDLGGYGVENITTHYVTAGQLTASGALLMKWNGGPHAAVYNLWLEDGDQAVPEPLVPTLPQLLARIITGGI